MWKGGAKKHGGFANAMAKQMKDWGVDLDESLGNPSGVKSCCEIKKIIENIYNNIRIAFKKVKEC